MHLFAKKRPRPPVTAAAAAPPSAAAPAHLLPSAVSSGGGVADLSAPSFELLGLQSWLVRACTAVGMRAPTPVQRACIPAILAGRDVIGCAQTGSGKVCVPLQVQRCHLDSPKGPPLLTRPVCPSIYPPQTATFALPILQKLSHDPYGIFALVLTPTRELAYQISDQFLALG